MAWIANRLKFDKTEAVQKLQNKKHQVKVVWIISECWECVWCVSLTQLLWRWSQSCGDVHRPNVVKIKSKHGGRAMFPLTANKTPSGVCVCVSAVRVDRSEGGLLSGFRLHSSSIFFLRWTGGVWSLARSDTLSLSAVVRSCQLSWSESPSSHMASDPWTLPTHTFPFPCCRFLCSSCTFEIYFFPRTPFFFFVPSPSCSCCGSLYASSDV